LPQSTCFNFSSFYRFAVEPLLVNALKSPVNRNWNSAPVFSLFDQWKYHSIMFYAIIFRRSRLPTTYIASYSDNKCYFAVTFIIFELPWKSSSSDAFYGFTSENGNPFTFACRQFFPLYAFQTSITLQWFWLLGLSRSNFLHSDRLISSALSYSTILILLLILYSCSSFTFDCFTLWVVLPKNKIRSIINSFKLLKTERRDF
jgi:hypothetical protein